MPPPEHGNGDRGSDARASASDPELERLRRRVYASGASEQDRSRYAAAITAQEATPTVEPQPPERQQAAPRRRGLVLVAGAAVVVAASVAIALGTVRTPAPLPRPVRSTIAPPIVLIATTFANDPDSAQVLDRVFEKPGSASSAAAAGFLAGVARSNADLFWASRTVRTSGGGTAPRGVVAESETRGVLLQRGYRVILSVLSRVPTAVEWRILGYRPGEPRTPHEVLVVRTPPFTASRAVFASVVLPADVTVTSFRVAVSPRSALAYDYLVELPR